MEKLIELLNEYNEWWHWRDENFDRNKLLVISKKYWFIKWLVENDKIDQTNKFCVSVNVEWKGMGYTKAFEGYESLLMLLSISDTPIEDLISYLK